MDPSLTLVTVGQGKLPKSYLLCLKRSSQLAFASLCHSRLFWSKNIASFALQRYPRVSLRGHRVFEDHFGFMSLGALGYLCRPTYELALPRAYSN